MLLKSPISDKDQCYSTSTQYAEYTGSRLETRLIKEAGMYWISGTRTSSASYHSAVVSGRRGRRLVWLGCEGDLVVSVGIVDTSQLWRENTEYSSGTY